MTTKKLGVLLACYMHLCLCMDNQNPLSHLDLEHKLNVLGDIHHSHLATLQANPFLQLLNALIGNNFHTFSALFTEYKHKNQISNSNVNELFREAISRNRPNIGDWLMKQQVVALTKHIVEDAYESEDPERMVLLISVHPDFPRCLGEYVKDEHAAGYGVRVPPNFEKYYSPQQ